MIGDDCMVGHANLDELHKIATNHSSPDMYKQLLNNYYADERSNDTAWKISKNVHVVAAFPVKKNRKYNKLRAAAVNDDSYSHLRRRHPHTSYAKSVGPSFSYKNDLPSLLWASDSRSQGPIVN